MTLFWTYVAVLLSAVVGFTFLPPSNSWLASGAHTLIGWLAVSGTVVAMIRFRPAGAMAWYLFSAGVFLNSTGIFEDQVLTHVFNVAKTPSVSDILWLALYPGLIWGMLVLIRGRNFKPDMTLLVDTATITTGVGLLAWIFLIHPVAANPDLSLLARMVPCIYPLGDVIVLGMMVRLLLGGGVRSFSCWLLICSLFSFLTADIGWAISGQISQIPPAPLQMILRTMTNCAFAFMGAAALHPSVVEMARPIKGRRTHLGSLLLTGLTGASLIGPFMLLDEVIRGKIVNGAAIAITSIVLFLLVVIRMVQSNRHLKEENEIRKQIESDLRLAKERADVASKAKSEFLANMSHEIRTPMNAVIGFSELLRSTEISKQQKDYIDTICTSGELLISLINDILDISKIESRKIELEKIDFDLEYLITSVLKILRQRAEAKSIGISLTFPGDLPRSFKGDPTRIRQILMNLVGNAIKFTDEGEITVRVWADNEVSTVDTESANLNFSIKDSGIGIPREKQQEIFEAFTQVDSSITRQYGGSGLGLTITKSLIEMMGGRIRVESEPGKGSEFIFSLLLIKGCPTVEKDIQLIALQHLTGKKVLIVDDNAHAREILRNYCAQAGMRILSDMPSVARTMEWLESSSELPDVILSDIMMPAIDGFTFAKKIRAIETLKDLKLIALTSDAVPGNAGQLGNAGFDGFLSKPFTRQELFEIMRAVFGDMRTGKHEIITSHMAHELQKKEYSILVAEDNAVNQKLLRILLQQFGCVVDFANDGREAVLKAGEKSYDVVLMDIQMPVMDGFEATTLIRNRLKLDVPIIALTGHVFKEDEERSRQHGMNDFLTKPVEAKLLQEKIVKWAGK
jgi:signal transduction histidine kinase/CheY-like chemotaxis protein